MTAGSRGNAVRANRGIRGLCGLWLALARPVLAVAFAADAREKVLVSNEDQGRYSTERPIWKAVALAILLSMVVSARDAQTQAVCSNTPESGEWIECTEDATSSENIDISTSRQTITTTGTEEPGIKATHEGSGDISITSNSDTITTAGGTDNHAIWAEHEGSSGNVAVQVNSATIVTGNTAPTGTIGSAGVYVKSDTDTAGTLDVDIMGGSILSSGSEATGVLVRHLHKGTGAGTPTTLEIGGGIEITSEASDAHGIDVSRRGNGNLILNLQDATIDTGATGVTASHLQQSDDNTDVGDVTVDLLGGVSITTSSDNSTGIYSRIFGENTTHPSHLLVRARETNNNNTITTQGHYARGIDVIRVRSGLGNVQIDAEGIEIDTKGEESHGIVGTNKGVGDVHIEMSGGSITTRGLAAHGIMGHRPESATGSGDIIIRARNLHVLTESTALHPSFEDTFANGVYAVNESSGNIDIDLGGGSITTNGTSSFGIYGDHRGVGHVQIRMSEGTITTGGSATGGWGIYGRHRDTGNIVIDLDDLTLTTTGQYGHGIVAYHYGTGDSRTMTVSLEGTVNVSGTGAQGVRVGTVSDDGPARMAALDTEGYRQQTVTVNGPITSAAEGVYIANGGRVIIGPRGSIDSGSGIAILATGTVPEVPEDSSDPNNIIPAIPAIPPKLRVDLNLGGRMIGQALHEGWIVNDGGQTTLAVNNTVLHDGATGVTGNTAHNGAWNVRMLADGVNVTDYSNADPAMWTVTERSEGLIAGRDFSAADFTETRRPPPPPPPPPPPEPDPPPVDAENLREVVQGAVANALGGIVGNPITPPVPSGQRETPEARESPSSPFVETYAPRAALYEALPAALLGLNDAGQGTVVSDPQGDLSFARTLDKRGGVTPADSTVGQRHSFEYDGVQLGRHLELGESLGASAALHQVRGTIDVAAGTGGGKIGVEATGFILDGAWKGPEGFYARTGLSMTHYRLGARSEDRAVGRLASGVGARGALARIEAGRRVYPGGGLAVAPRICFQRSALSVDDFTDAVGSRVSVPGTARVTAGMGMAAKAERRAGAGELALRGSMDLVHVLDGRTTVVEVSGTRLASKANDTELRLDLSGVYRQGRWSLAAEASVNSSDLGDARGAVGMRLSASF